MNDDGKVAAVAAKDIFLTINGTWFSRLAIFSKPVGRAIQPFRAIARWLRRGRVLGCESRHKLRMTVGCAFRPTEFAAGLKGLWRRIGG
jgi:hypothetical protein